MKQIHSNIIIVLLLITALTSCSNFKNDKEFLVSHLWKSEDGAIIDFLSIDWSDSTFSVCIYNLNWKEVTSFKDSTNLNSVFDYKTKVSGKWNITNGDKTIRQDSVCHIITITCGEYPTLELNYCNYNQLELNVKNSKKELIFKRKRYYNFADNIY